MTIAHRSRPSRRILGAALALLALGGIPLGAQPAVATTGGPGGITVGGGILLKRGVTTSGSPTNGPSVRTPPESAPLAPAHLAGTSQPATPTRR